MHGVIFVELKKFVDARFGDATWPRLLSRAGLTDRIYLSVQEYEDGEAAALIAQAGAQAGLSTDAFFQQLGEFMAPDLLRMYGSLLQRDWKTLDVVEHAEATIRRVMRARNPSAPGLRLAAERTRPDEIVVTYASSRRMCGLAKGVVRGVARHFQEPVTIEETACMHEGAAACHIRIRRA